MQRVESAVERLGERRASALTLLGALSVALIGIVDGLSGFEFGYSPFYLIPVTVVSFYGGRRAGVAVAFLASAAWYLADLYAMHVYAHPLAAYWNTGVRLLIFTVVALMLAQLKSNIRVERLQREKLAELNRLKNQFVGMAAHDLRTPLAVISMCTESLRRRQGEATDPRQAESLKVITEKCDFMLAMVAGLLDLSAIESGSLSLNRKLGAYGDFVRRHLDILRVLADRRQITFEFAAQELPPMCFDEGRVEQVLDNLVMNALKFSPARSVVTVAVTREGDQVVTRVSDQGPGIPAEEAPHVFTAFKKTSVMPAAGEKGAGLGLAIAKKIVEAHGGEIGVASVRGHGASFTFTLPLGGC